MNSAKKLSSGRSIFASLLIIFCLSITQMACDSTFGDDRNSIKIPVNMEYRYGLAGPYDFGSSQLVFPFERAALDSLFAANGIAVDEINSTESITATVFLDEPANTDLSIFEQIILIAGAPNSSDLEIGSIDLIPTEQSSTEISFELRSNRDVSDLLAIDNFELRLQVRPRQSTIDESILYRLRVRFSLNAFVNDP